MARATANKRTKKGRGGDRYLSGGREREKKPRTKKKRFLVSAAAVAFYGPRAWIVTVAIALRGLLRDARNREPRLIKRRRAIVNDTPRLVVKDRGISKRVTAVTPSRSIDRNRLRGEGGREARLYIYARTHARAI